ncbi:MAG TPA: histidinol-phosphate transaminase [Saprospiraceae bacterium]|nr:histidinol-phosphate transaminase [Saprospiraceae bacterium]
MMDRRSMLKWTGLMGGATLMNGVQYLETWERKLNGFKTEKGEKVVKLDSNENPFGPSKSMREAMMMGMDEGYLYPWKRVSELAGRIAESVGVPRDHILVTAGSREGLSAAGVTYASNGREVITCSPTFDALMTYAARFGGYINSVPLDKTHGFDLDTMERRISSHTGLVFVCNPNNPTGSILRGEDLKSFCTEVSKRTIVFVDEVYYDYIDERNYPTMIDLVKEGKNVIVARTFSKIYGLAGIRVGFLVARPEIVARLRANQMASSNIMGVMAAQAALQDKEFYKESLQRNLDARQFLYSFFDGMGMEYLTSHTNFVYFKSGRNIEKLIGQMAEYNVIIGRPFPPMMEWCRISTGTMEDMYTFGDALRKVMA